MSEVTAPSRYHVADRPPRTVTDFFLRWETILVALLVVTVVVNATLSPYFLDVGNLLDATFNFSEKAMIALGMALLIIARDIDLSVAAVVAFVSLVMGFSPSQAPITGALLVIALATEPLVVRLTARSLPDWLCPPSW